MNEALRIAGISHNIAIKVPLIPLGFKTSIMIRDHYILDHLLIDLILNEFATVWNK